MNNLFFVSSMPRSGSTLLMNLLGQNPNHYVTPTSGLIELFVNNRNSWKKYIEFKAEGLNKVKHRIEGALKGTLLGYFEKELLEKKVVFDKSRGWLQYIEDVESVLKSKIKIIVNLRDVRAVVASFEKIYRKRGIDFEYAVGDAFFKCQTIEGRCEHLLSPGGIVGIYINRLRDALARGKQDRLIILPYHKFTSYPQECMNILHKVLNLKNFNYDPNNVKQVTYEDDTWHGMDLHNIQPQITTQDKPTWEKILPDKYAEQIAERYADINKLIYG